MILEGTGQPLVSIIVITYNSSKYILETLESAKAQTYQNIELIVSDDCSKDNTVEICSNWIEKNKNRFIKTQLITTENNSGITPNCNRGLFAASGQWVKFIAGDDILLDSCIRDNIQCVTMNTSISFLFSKMRYIDKESKTIDKVGNDNEELYQLSPKKQFRKLLIKNWLNAPSALLKRKTLIELKAFDESTKFIEDYPLWLKATRNNFKLFFLSVPTVGYRLHSEAFSQVALSEKIKKELLIIFYKYKLPNISLSNFLYLLYEYLTLIEGKIRLTKYLKKISQLLHFKKV